MAEEDKIPGGRFVLDSAKLTVPFAVHARERSRSVISAGVRLRIEKNSLSLSLFLPRASKGIEEEKIVAHVGGGRRFTPSSPFSSPLFSLFLLLSFPSSAPRSSLFLRARLSQESSARSSRQIASSRGEREPTVESDYIVNTKATLPCLE